MRKAATITAAFIAGIAATFAGLRRLAKTREDTEWKDAPRPGKVLAVDGVAIHYVETVPRARSQDSVPAIVMIHGFGGNTFSFRHQLAEFGADYRAVAIDLKGFGFSERTDRGGDYSISEQARLMLRAMDLLSIERAIVIGHSMGGEVAMRMAATSPERVEKLVLAASVSGERAPIMPRLAIFRPTFGFFTKLSAFSAWRRMFYDRSQVDEKALRAGYLAPGRIKGTLNTIWEMWEDIRHDKPVEYKRLTMPALILWAEKERIVPLAGRALRQLRKHLPHAEFQTIPRTGHLLLEENPTDSNNALHRFIGGAREKPAPNVDHVPQPA